MVKEISPQGIPALLAFLLEQAAQGMCGCWMCTGMVIALLERLLHFRSYKVGQKRWGFFLIIIIFLARCLTFCNLLKWLAAQKQCNGHSRRVWHLCFMVALNWRVTLLPPMQSTEGQKKGRGLGGHQKKEVKSRSHIFQEEVLAAEWTSNDNICRVF